MAEIRKYMFDVDFSPPPLRPVQPVVEEADEDEEIALPPAQMFTEEELTLAREGAFEEGRRHGKAESDAEIAHRTLAALEAIGAHMSSLAGLQAEANDEAARNAVKVAMAAVAKMLPAACEAHAFGEVTRVVEEVVGQILDEPRIIVRVAEAMIEEVRPRLEAAAETRGFEGRVVVQGDARLQVGDCRVEWADGGAERDQARLMKDIEATIARALAPPERRPDEQLPEAGA